jgi:uncharacterized protein YpuA (DUF1002 family)
MEKIIRDIKDIEGDIDKLISRAEEYRKDAERGINVNHTCEGDLSWTKQDKINSLFEYLEDAKDDIDRMKDDLKVVKDYLTNLLDDVEYESIRQKVTGES